MTFPLKWGDPESLLDPNTIILSENIATKYFGEEDPVGKTLVMTFDQQARITATIGGVAAQFPSNTGFRFGILMEINHLRELGNINLDDWAVTSGMFIHVPNPEDIDEIEAQTNQYISVQNAANPDWKIQKYEFGSFTNPASDYHTVRGRVTEGASPVLSVMFLSIALVMLCLSCFNYINISLGSASQRLKEIGMRKVIGGNRRQLIMQFMTENILLCLFALVLGVFIAKLFFVPLFNSIFIIQVYLTMTENLSLWVFLVVLLIGVGIISGAYPALYISSFRPTAIFRGSQQLAGNAWFTRAFLTFQFVLAFITVIMSVVMSMNTRYVIGSDWGYDSSNTLIVELQEEKQYELLRDVMIKSPDVEQIAGAFNHVGREINRQSLKDETGATRDIISFTVGPNYLQTMGIELKSGRYFDEARIADAEQSIMVNERFVTAMGWEEAEGKTVQLDGIMYEVVGVVKDVTYFFLVDPTETIFHTSNERNFNYIAIHHRDGAEEAVESFVEQNWSAMFPLAVLTHFQQETVFDVSFSQLNNVIQAFSYISGLAILIACMGLFGLASQNVSRRMKEVSIRKVVGASLPDLAIMVNRRFFGMLLIASVIAITLSIGGITALLAVVRESIPISHMPLTPVPFIYACGLVFAMSAVALGAHVLKIRDANPAAVLRND